MYRYLWTAAYKGQIMEKLKIIQHNVLYWTRERAIEPSNHYRTMDADIVLLNLTSTFDTERNRIYNYNVIQRNTLTERNAGVAIAIRSNSKYKPIDDFVDDILGIEIDTTKGPINILTCYCPPQEGLYTRWGSGNQTTTSEAGVCDWGYERQHAFYGVQTI